MHRRVIGSFLVLALAACSTREEVNASVVAAPAEATSTAASQGSNPPQPPAPPMAIAGAERFEDNEKNGAAERNFEYAWPKEVSAIPALAAKLTEDREKGLAFQKKEWSESVAEFGTDGCVSCVMRDASTTWEVVTNTPRFLSISSGSYYYSGGAHGNSATGGMVWDRKAEASMDARQFFRSDSALWNAAQSAYCSALNEEREERRGRPVQADDYGSECPELEDLTLLAGSSNGQTFDRLGFIADPYVAGPYAEGLYEVTLPVTDAILAAVKSEYREYFSVK